MNIGKTKLIFILLILFCFNLSWFVLRPITKFNETFKYIYIHTGEINKEQIIKNLDKQNILKNTLAFKILCVLFNYDKKIKPGKYLIKKGSNSVSIFWELLKGRQEPVRLVINKFRTRENLAGTVSLLLECDSTSLVNYMNDMDSMKSVGLDTNTAMTLIIPNTYSIFWDITASGFWKRMKKENAKFWTNERLQKAKNHHLSKEQVYILASIVEEETNKNDEKGLISSVYMNRMNKGMPLGADPTIKFAIRDFSIKRISFAHISLTKDSPYNTYKNKGLPPGPICTPSIKTIDAVLNSTKSEYLFFCARPDFSGYHNFATNAREHFQNARAYQNALDEINIK